MVSSCVRASCKKVSEDYRRSGYFFTNYHLFVLHANILRYIVLQICVTRCQENLYFQYYASKESPRSCQNLIFKSKSATLDSSKSTTWEHTCRNNKTSLEEWSEYFFSEYFFTHCTLVLNLLSVIQSVNILSMRY